LERANNEDAAAGTDSELPAGVYSVLAIRRVTRVSGWPTSFLLSAAAVAFIPC